MVQQYLEIGQITNTHGVMGELKVQPWCDSPEFFCQFKTLYADKAHRPVKVERARPHKNMVILKLEGVSDMDAAIAMRNVVLYIDRKDAKLPQGAFFLADIEGLEARDAETGKVLGKVAEVLTMPAHNVYVIRGGERELLIPAVPTFVAETNVEEGFIRVNLVEGL